MSEFLSQSTKKILTGTLLCFRILLVSKKLMDKKGGWNITIFCQKRFVSQCQKNVQESFIVSLILVCKDFFCIRGVGHDFCRKILSPSAEKNCTCILCVSLISDIENSYALEG